ncbi:Concanavalin A-like lectin/glucanase superfamily, partial [Cynara cardunculus var. scolymus]
MGSNAVEDGGYSSLNDFKLEIVNQEGDVNGSFSLCFWLYLPADSSPFPSTLLRQHHSDSSSHAPFLVLTANKEMVVYPIHFVPQEAPIPSDGTEIPSAKTKIEFEFPLNKWVHIGCEMSTDIIRLHINGEIVGETCISLTFDSSRKVSLVGLGANEDDLVDGFVHGVEIFPITSSIKDYFVKASCRRNFSLDVNLMDAFGHSVNKEMEVLKSNRHFSCTISVIASLTYADNGAYVEKPDDAEAPLLTSYDGIELFRIKFNIPKMGRRYPFLEVFSRSIRCISRNRNTRPSTLIWKRPTSAMHSGSGTSWLDGGSVEPVHNIVHEAKPSPSSKRVKLGQGNPFVNLSSNTSFKQGDHEGNKQDDRLNGRISEGRQEMRDGTTHNSSSDSDSSEATNSCKSRSSNGSSVSDLTVFKYCLGTVTEKSLLLKDLANSASEQDLMEFAVQVSQLSGCLHHRNQIRISKRMIEEGTNAWNLISRNNHNGLWDNMILVISELFMKVARCRNRFLTQQESVSRENFEKLWCWLYPVAFGLSQNGLNEMWDSRWIEGLVTKEEAESSLQGPGGGLVDPGTFVLRFPTSRSWPHPDAGNLIVTYVGSDFAIHHRL